MCDLFQISKGFDILIEEQVEQLTSRGAYDTFS